MHQFAKKLGMGFWGFLCVFCGAWAAEVPDAYTSAGPALSAFNGERVLAWAGAPGIGVHRVWVSKLHAGIWSPPAEVPGALTRTAPALGSAAQQLFLATTPPDVDNKVHYYATVSGEFENDAQPLCDAVTCAHTLAAPALLGAGAALYAAWSTPAGAIMYATYINGVWDIAPLPIPNGVTSPSTGPTLSIHGNRLFVAWVNSDGETLSVASSPLPLTSAHWSAISQIAAETEVAPALSVFTVPNPAPNAQSTTSEALFLAWTAADSKIKFARYDTQLAIWVPGGSPIPLPSGPLTSFTPALGSFTPVGPNEECIASNDIGWTDESKPRHKIDFRQVTTPCP